MSSLPFSLPKKRETEKEKRERIAAFLRIWLEVFFFAVALFWLCRFLFSIAMMKNTQMDFPNK